MNPKALNKLLRRQVKKHLGPDAKISEEYKELLLAISASYDHYEADRKMIERSMDISSNELTGMHIKLKDQAEEERKLNDQLTNANQALVESQAHYQLLFDKTPVGVYHADLEGNIRYMNDYLARMLGYTDAKMFDGRNISEFYNDPRERKQIINKLTTEREAIGYTLNLKTIEGEEKEVFVIANIYQDHIHALLVDLSENVATEIALKESEEKYRLLMDSINDGLSYIDSDGKIAYINDQFTQMLGFSFDEVRGKHGHDLFLVDPKDKKRLKEKTELRRNGVADSYEMKMKQKSGDIIWVKINGRPVFDEKGSYQGTVAIHSDITRQRKTDEELRRYREDLESLVTSRTLELRNANHQLRKEIQERKMAQVAKQKSEKRFQDVFLNSPVAIFVEDYEGNILDANRAASDFHGMTKEELMAKNVFDLVPERNLRRVKMRFEKILDGDLTPFESSSLLADGSEIPVEIHVSKVEYNEKPALIFHVSDISERKKNEKLRQNLLEELELRIKERTRELENEKGFLRAIIDANPNLIFVKDWDGRYITVNKAVADVYNLSVEEVEGKSLKDFNHEENEVSSYLEQDRQVMTDGQILRVHEDWVTDRRTGERKVYQTTKVPFVSADGKQRRILGVSTEVTQLKEITKQFEKKNADLIRSNQELEKFAYVASHDLQEPLRTVASYVQLIDFRYGQKLEKDAQEFMSFAVAGVKRMQNLIQDLLGYARLGSMNRPFRKTDGNNILKIVSINLKSKIEETNTILEVKNLPTIQADGTQLVQLFQNIIDNAIKFRSPDRQPKIKIDVLEQSRHWYFTIADNGIGIDEKFKEKVFTIFQRLHTIDRYPGTGIGLAICKKIVERHQGEIWVTGEVGKGTTFHIKLLKDLS